MLDSRYTPIYFIIKHYGDDERVKSRYKHTRRSQICKRSYKPVKKGSWCVCVCVCVQLILDLQFLSSVR